jgi:UDP-N-acetylglucosamine 2-epimerase (non-hydrolysing)
MKLMVVVGTRPEAIKLAPVIIEAEKRVDIETIVVATGQHKEMLEQMLNVFEIKPNVDLSIMKHDQNLCHITITALQGLYDAIESIQPDCVIVQGDTTTTFTGALAAFYHNIPIAHVEAGLRTFNKREPFPEEANRCMTSQLADFHFAPTELSQQNLLNEGVNNENVYVTGNTAIDALLLTLDKNLEKRNSKVTDKQFKTILVTAHRRENHGDRMVTICEAVLALVETFDDIDVLFPVHMSPKVREVVFQRLSNHPRINLVDPLNYVDFVAAMNDSYLILTDSGGVQEEAPSLGKPVLVLREQTERPEATIAGTAILVGADFNNIFNNAKKLLTDADTYRKMSVAENPYGDGTASKKIIDTIIERLK